MTICQLSFPPPPSQLTPFFPSFPPFLYSVCTVVHPTFAIHLLLAGTPSHHIFNLMKLKFSSSGFSDREKSGQLEHDVTPHFPLLVTLHLFPIFFYKRDLQFYKERIPFYVNMRNNYSGWNNLGLGFFVLGIMLCLCSSISLALASKRQSHDRKLTFNRHGSRWTL